MGYCVLSTKYHRWYEQLMLQAAGRSVPACYTEIHHVLPRSLGGTDAAENLVRLSYREHFLAHWLLTKMHTGAALRKMQRALLAMSLDKAGKRIVSSWQFDAAKRAVRDLELDPVAEATWYDRFRLAQKAKLESRKAAGLPVNRQQQKHFRRKRERSR